MAKSHGALSSEVRVDCQGVQFQGGKFPQDWSTTEGNLTFSSKQLWPRGEFFSPWKGEGCIIRSLELECRYSGNEGVLINLLSLSSGLEWYCPCSCIHVQNYGQYFDWGRIWGKRLPLFSFEHLEVAQGNSSLQGSQSKWSQKKLELFQVINPLRKEASIYCVADT